MNVPNSKSIMPMILAAFPHLESVVCVDDGIYSALGDFAIYLRDGITAKTITQNEVNEAIFIMNSMGVSKDLEVHNLLVVGIFELLTDGAEAERAIKLGLKGYALELFNKTSSGWMRS